LAHHFERHQQIDDDDDGRDYGHSERHGNHLFSLPAFRRCDRGSAASTSI